MNISHVVIGFCSGLLIGVAVFSHPISRAVVIGLLASVVIGDIVIDGVDGYLNWAAYIPAEMAKFTAFWIATVMGILGGALVSRTAGAANVHCGKIQCESRQCPHNGRSTASSISI